MKHVHSLDLLQFREKSEYVLFQKNKVCKFSMKSKMPMSMPELVERSSQEPTVLKALDHKGFFDRKENLTSTHC